MVSFKLCRFLDLFIQSGEFLTNSKAGSSYLPKFAWGQSYKANFGIKYIKIGLNKLKFTLNYINFDVGKSFFISINLDPVKQHLMDFLVVLLEIHNIFHNFIIASSGDQF